MPGWQDIQGQRQDLLGRGHSSKLGTHEDDTCRGSWERKSPVGSRSKALVEGLGDKVPEKLTQFS